MKNHYFTSYAGNKRKEIKDILPFINLDASPNITTIIEPFAGSAAMSYYISTLYPNRFKYILNDNDKINYDLFNISRDTERTQDFNNNINKIIDEFNTYTDDVNRKIFYNSVSIKTLEGYIFKNKYYSIRMGLYPMISRMNKAKPYKLQDYPVYDFYNNENIVYENMDGVEFINKYNENDDKLFLLDPPYLASCNDFYNNKDVNVYEWVFNNKSLLLDSKNKILFILENIWIIKLLLKDFKILFEYDKTYELNHKKTTHIIYSN
jgi:hypothetical protein